MKGLERKIHHTKRIIRKRVEIVKSMWGKDHPALKTPHKLHKWNLNCGCVSCHYYKNVGNSKSKHSHKDLKLYEQEKGV